MHQKINPNLPATNWNALKNKYQLTSSEIVQKRIFFQCLILYTYSSSENAQKVSKWPTQERRVRAQCNYHITSAVSAAKSDLTSFCPLPILINFFFVENLGSFCRPQVSLLTPLILLYDRHIWSWIIYDWKVSPVSATPNYRWIFLRPWRLKLRRLYGTNIYILV